MALSRDTIRSYVYHTVLRRAFSIITAEIPDASRDVVLQITVKAVNDTAGPDGLVPTLLVFGAYPRMTVLDPPAPSITQRATAIQKAMTEIAKLKAQRQVTDALRTRNGPDTTAIHELQVNSKVLVWRESSKWEGPFTLLGIENKTCKV